MRPDSGAETDPQLHSVVVRARLRVASYGLRAASALIRRSGDVAAVQVGLGYRLAVASARVAGVRGCPPIEQPLAPPLARRAAGLPPLPLDPPSTAIRLVP